MHPKNNLKIWKLAETIQKCGLYLTDFASWDTWNMKIGNLANLLPKFIT
jgi:hypothetical protein